jgi:hypothetical protein
MAVRGIGIRLGQVWNIGCGKQVAITNNDGHAKFPWLASVIGGSGAVTLSYDNEGRCYSRSDLALKNLANSPVADSHEALTFHALQEPEQRTNPKDAISDKKLPLWLLSPIAKAQWAVCQFVGLVKYGAWNWRAAGVRSSVYLSAMQRHMDAYVSGEEVDPIDGTPHLGHIMACAAILIDAKAAGKLTDDRPPSVGLREAYAEAEQQMVAIKDKALGSVAPRHYTIADTEVTK